MCFVPSCPLVCLLSIQGKRLPAYLSADAEEGEVSDDDSADEIEDDFKLKSSNVSTRSVHTYKHACMQEMSNSSFHDSSHHWFPVVYLLSQLRFVNWCFMLKTKPNGPNEQKNVTYIKCNKRGTMSGGNTARYYKWSPDGLMQGWGSANCLCVQTILVVADPSKSLPILLDNSDSYWLHISNIHCSSEVTPFEFRWTL